MFSVTTSNALLANTGTRKRSRLRCDETLAESPCGLPLDGPQRPSRRLLFSPPPLPLCQARKRPKRFDASIGHASSRLTSQFVTPQRRCSLSTDVSKEPSLAFNAIGDRLDEGASPLAYATKQTSFEEELASQQRMPRVQMQRKPLVLWLSVDAWIDPLRFATPYDSVDGDTARHAGFSLIDFLKRRRREFRQILAEASDDLQQVDRKAHPDEATALRMQVERLQETLALMHDWQLNLYVAQAMDLALATHNGAPNLQGTRRDCFLTLSLAALSLIIKQHHSDTHNYLAFQMQEMAEYIDCDSALFVELEFAYLRATDYNVLRFCDVYTALFTDPLAVFDTEQRLQHFLHDDTQLRHCTAFLRRMIVDHVDRFMHFAPSVRTAVAVAHCRDQRVICPNIARRCPEVQEAFTLLRACIGDTNS